MATIGSTRAGHRSGPIVLGPAVHMSTATVKIPTAVNSRAAARALPQSMNARAGMRNQAM